MNSNAVLIQFSMKTWVVIIAFLKNTEEIEFQIIAIDRTPNDDSLTENCAAMETKTVACNEHMANNSMSFKSDFCVRQQLDECQIFLK